MPQYRVGDIFEISRNEAFELAIILGHIGFNFMSHHWRQFQKDSPRIEGIRDPFSSRGQNPIEYQPGQWLWFIGEDENHGMTDSQVAEAMNEALIWAKGTGLKRVITNGIRDVDHGPETAANRESDDARAQFLNRLVSDREQESELSVTLVSLNDVFTRNFPSSEGA